MKTSYKFTLIACLLGSLTACQSSNTSFTNDKAQEKATNMDTKPESNAEKAQNKNEIQNDEVEKVVEEKKVEVIDDVSTSATNMDTKPESNVEKAAEEKKVEAIDGFSTSSRAVSLTSSASLSADQGKQYGEGYSASPALNADTTVGWVVNPGLNYEFANPETNKTIELTQLIPNADFLNNGKIDPNTVQEFVLTDNGIPVGTFKFVNQSYSSYATFVPEKTITEDYGDGPEERSYQNLEMFVINPTKETEFTQLEGTARYSGYTLGYVDGVNGSTPKVPYVGNINLLVDFSNKEISGSVSNRQDGLVKYNYKFTDDDDQPTAKGIELSKQDLILKPTKIESVNGTMVFGVDAHDNVVILDDGEEKAITGYSGAFAGPKAEEVVGSIGNAEEKIIFGATKK
ncbi:transferrin-binding protein-like solute binding protein [Avibacterium sp. 21-586]|uniref:hypothetical protein n=1 Tax=Avibacterium sp. 21-586 TaxID=2911534 RepID=UPI002246214A|nr:hypothetical protein [Avibacterium sp. 21-586]MCW9710290.1 transferrin-binding protein-like solute binding protein [Avibacterium sp. 21-586]